MILNSPENRKIVTEYLESISEDDLINEIIIPTFSKYGFRVYRIVGHGPGEHGKDVILVRYDQLHLAEEFIAVQAKAEKATAENVNGFASQVNRAMKTGFPRLAGRGKQKPHFVFFINARRHTNDANEEFMQLIDRKNHARIFAQEQVCDLILSSGVGPKALLENVTHASAISEHDIDRHVYQVLMADEPRKVDHLMAHELALVAGEVSDRIKKMVIDFAFKKWDEDQSWDGTVRPMRWLAEHFDFIQPEQFRHLIRVIREYTASNPSYAAASDTSRIFRRIGPQHIVTFADDFVRLAAAVVRNKTDHWQDVARLAKSLFDAEEVRNPILGTIVELAQELEKRQEEIDRNRLRSLREKLDDFLDRRDD